MRSPTTKAPKSVQPAPRRRAWLPIVALAAVTLAAYSNSFNAGLIFDNRGLILQDARIHSTSPENIARIIDYSYWWPYGESGLYRPLTTFSYLFNYTILGNGENPFGYHAVNLALHFLNVLLVFALARRLLKRDSDLVPALAAALWAVHPVLTESVTNVVGRADLLAGASILGGLLLYLRFTETGAWRWLAALAVSTAIGAFSKESAVCVAGVIVLYELTWRRCWRHLLYGVLSTAPGIVWMLAQRAKVMSQVPMVVFPPWDNPLAAAGFWTAKLTALKLVANYLGLLFVPWRLSCDYSYAQVQLFSGGIADWLTLLFVIAIAAAALWMYRIHRPVFFLAAFAAITFLPTSNILFPIGAIMAERFLYLPAVAVAITTAVALGALERRLGKARLAQSALAVLIVLFAARTWARNLDWRDDVSLMSAAVSASPNSFKAHMGLALALFESDPGHTNINRIVAESERGLAILDTLPEAQRSPSAYFEAGGYLLAQGDAPRAIATFEKCRRIALANHAGLVAQAVRAGLRAPDLDNTRIADLERGVSQASLQLKDFAGAVSAARRAIEANPASSASFGQLADSLHAAGRDDAAAVAMVEGILMTRDMSLRAELLERYQRGLDPLGCAVVAGPNGPALNPDCPTVRRHSCTALADAMRLYIRTNRRDAARQLKAAAIQDSGCPAAPLNEILP